jgi:hypothetical protein
MYRVLIVSIFGLLCTGCGSNNGLAHVSGQVTLDGRPLEGVVVQFQPLAREGSPSAGITDADGHYELMYSLSESGVMLGDHQVTIRTADCYYDEADGAAAQDSIPARYNDKSELRCTVDSSTRKLNFALTSKP